jgi:hypothetical protein
MPDADGDIEMKRQREAMDEDEDDSKGEGQVAEAAQAPAELQDGQVGTTHIAGWAQTVIAFLPPSNPHSGILCVDCGL